MVTIFGYAKINLTLDILGLRDDGYHEIATVMQSLALKDTLTLRRREEGIGLSVDVPGLESDERNLAYRAAALLIEACGVRGGVDIDIVKRIPVAAGLAGGSADAAATLRGMNALYDLGLTDEELCGFGAPIGSDIPFSIMGGTVFATGRGEVMRRLADFPETPVLEPVTEAAHPVIAAYRARMRRGGAVCAMMSGSGPTVFGLFADADAAVRTFETFRAETDAEVHLTRTAGRRNEMV